MLKFFVATIIGSLLAGQAVAEPAPCATCDTPKSMTVREKIKADREKYERDDVKTVARPWDGESYGRSKWNNPVPDPR
ncbi:hypothetical protein SAMN05444159_1708 [Bradyrhizobium lablabi]|uniref:Uncharacterized protein n=1 Tax=Bradyrhizobium lablabi TaxID=722472 RepID=A0A1M6MR73_9BRAD|nr:hypothetical protein [Bradyrhizobium lablabi]SHJ85906.1 hypothetical protein SAMN05444159_1708 [Bradyrhizobium lablabi]